MLMNMSYRSNQKLMSFLEECINLNLLLLKIYITCLDNWSAVENTDL